MAPSTAPQDFAGPAPGGADEDALSAYDFTLPDAQIALRPAEPRDAARLLRVPADGDFIDACVRDLPKTLRAGDLLVVNDTKVIPAALKAIRPARAAGGSDVAVDVNLTQRVGPSTWAALARPGKRLAAGDCLRFGETLSAQIEAKGAGGDITLAFDQSGADLDAALAAIGAPPLPPYIARRRSPDAQDVADYQTVFAEHPGSVAAPTAGLHFTPALLAALDAAGVGRTAVTLHVGAGTFLPVKPEEMAAGRLHTETYAVPKVAAEAVARTKASGGRVIPVGTTSLRTLEAAAHGAGGVRPGPGDTQLFIQPGYRFQVADALMTNFHLPRSSLFMLVCAFCGTVRMQAAYAHAIASEYRFYSYGDACLLERS